MNPETASFGEVLRQLRTAAALSQEALAERAGLSLRGLSDLERGARRTPHLATVAMLADALELSPEDRQALLAAARPEPSLSQTFDTFDGRTLAVPLTPLVGRGQELVNLSALLRRSDTRLVTLAGPGWVGKTRLGLQPADDVGDHFADGAIVVSLEPVTDPALVASTIAHAVGVQEAAGRSLMARLQNHLRDKDHLLVLDNFEQVVETAPLVAELLGSCPGVTFLITSRVALRVSGEHVYAVSPLPTPEPGTAIAIDEHASDAVRLFADRATAADRRFALTQANAETVAGVCAGNVGIRRQGHR